MRHRRNGSIYILVLGAAMLVMVIGLSALMAVRVERRSAQGSSDLAQARFFALSAVEIGLLRIAQNPNWRTTYPSGTWVTDEPIGGGTFSLDGVDPADNDLSNSPTDPVVLTGTGFMGQARYRVQGTVTAQIKALSCLEVAMHADNDLNFTGTVVQCNQIISANNSVNASGSTINSDVEAVNTISGGGYTGTTTNGIPARTLPDATVFDYYLSNGTTINYAAIPLGEITNMLISPTSNPYGGGTNPEGIYVIDCQGQALKIENSRIVATLVLLNAGPGTQVRSAVHWSPAVANYPALLVQGNLKLKLTRTLLTESLTGTNFNPPATPLRGMANTTTSDVYSSRIQGIVYVSNDLEFPGDKYTTLDGVLVVGNNITTNPGAVIDLRYRSIYLDNPPPGFFVVPKMVLTPGSWRPLVDPP